jgi:hypothetical protein
MYQLVRNRTLRAFSTDTAPPLFVALLIAELFFKWHSFTLECVGFLATWFVLDWLWTSVLSRARSRAADTSGA